MKKPTFNTKVKLYSLELLVILFLIGCSKSDVTDDSIPIDPDPNPPLEEIRVEEVDESVRHFMQQYGVTGASVAFTKDEQLVYARGYGFADETTGDEVTTSSLFRISSISKSVTSIAIMTLIEEGKLSLDDKVFGPQGILGNQYGKQPYGRYITDIKVKHLLQHSSGGWSNQNNDPTMQDQSLSKEGLLEWILHNRPLDFAPGTRYIYSNVGYLIAGLIIEELSGMSYEDYVDAILLEPLGIEDMYIGGSTYEDKLPQEVRYHSDAAYDYNFERRDANGGWIATPIALLRLFVSIDGFDRVPDILEPGTINMMTTPSLVNENYAAGFTVDSYNTWSHSGSFYGSRSYSVIRTQNGFSGVIFVNSTSGGSFSSDLQEIVVGAINDNKIEWPNQDLFN